MVGFVVFFCTDVTRCHGLVGLLDCFYMILTVCLVFVGGVCVVCGGGGHLGSF